MKLRNKLLPLTGIATIAATTVPLALTSCGNDMKMVDISKGYVPSITPTDEVYLGQQEASKVYFDAVKKNPEVFKQDILFGEYQNFCDSEKGKDVNTTYNKFNIGVTTPTFGSVKVCYPGEKDITYPTISFSMKIQVDAIKKTVDETSGYIENHLTINWSVKYDNIPFYAWLDDDYYDIEEANSNLEERARWIVGVADAINNGYVFQYNASKWSMDYSLEQSNIRTVYNKGETSKEETSFNRSGNVSDYFKLMKVEDEVKSMLAFQYESYYLSTAGIKPELSPIINKDGSIRQVRGLSTTDSTDVSVVGLDDKGSCLAFMEQTGIQIDHIEMAETSDIVLEQTKVAEGVTPAKITIAKNAKFESDPYYYAPATLSATLNEGTYYFTCPKTFKIKFVLAATTEDAIEQTVYTNVDTFVLKVVSGE